MPDTSVAPKESKRQSIQHGRECRAAKAFFDPVDPVRRELHTVHNEVYEFPTEAIKSLVKINLDASTLWTKLLFEIPYQPMS